MSGTSNPAARCTNDGMPSSRKRPWISSASDWFIAWATRTGLDIWAPWAGWVGCETSSLTPGHEGKDCAPESCGRRIEGVTAPDRARCEVPRQVAQVPLPAPGSAHPRLAERADARGVTLVVVVGVDGRPVVAHGEALHLGLAPLVRRVEGLVELVP